MSGNGSPPGGLPTGRVDFVPNECYIPYFPVARTVEQLLLWIVFAGSSVTRGNVLTWLDGLLGVDVTVSSVWKCWAWFDVRVGRLRFSYLDFRPEYWANELDACPSAAPTSKGNNVTLTTVAHSYVTHPDYNHRAAGFLRLLTSPGSLDGASLPPDVFMMEMWSTDKVFFPVLRACASGRTPTGRAASSSTPPKILPGFRVGMLQSG